MDTTETNIQRNYTKVNNKNIRFLREYSQKGNAVLVIIILFLLFFGITLFVNFYSRKISSNVYNLRTKNLKGERFVLIGYNEISKSILPLILNNIKFKEYIILDTLSLEGENFSEFNGLNFNKKKIEGKYTNEIISFLKNGDIVLDVQSNPSSLNTIRGAIKEKKINYLTYSDIVPTANKGYYDQYIEDIAEKIYGLIYN